MPSIPIVDTVCESGKIGHNPFREFLSNLWIKLYRGQRPCPKASELDYHGVRQSSVFLKIGQRKRHWRVAILKWCGKHMPVVRLLAREEAEDLLNSATTVLQTVPEVFADRNLLCVGRL